MPAGRTLRDCQLRWNPAHKHNYLSLAWSTLLARSFHAGEAEGERAQALLLGRCRGVSSVITVLRITITFTVITKMAKMAW